MKIGQQKRRLWGGPVVTSTCLLVFAAIAAVASWQADPAELPSAIRLDSGWIFHVLFGAVAFFVIYVVAALVTYTVSSGAPLTKLGLWRFSFEGPAAETLAEGAASLKGIHEELGNLNQRTDELIAIATESERDLGEIARRLGDSSALTEASARRSDRLNALARTDEETRRRTAEAVARFEVKFAELERLFEESETRG